MIRTRLAVERALAEAFVAVDCVAGKQPDTRWTEWSADVLSSPVAHRQPLLQRTSYSSSRPDFSIAEPSGALHWATPETISKFGPHDSDDESAFFSDDGI